MILEHARGLRVLIVGDVCLDRWCRYDPALAEVSRETGIPRTAVVATEVTPGAAGTVANNLASLRTGRVEVLGVCGDDGFGYELQRAMAARGISPEALVTVAGWPTFTYTKLINRTNDVEDLARVDFVATEPLPAAVEEELAAALERRVPECDAVIVSDQAETSAGGVVTARVRETICGLAARYPEKVFLADSRKRSMHFRGVILKPNQDEAEAASRAVFGRIDFPALRAHTQAPVLMVTHGGEGVLVVRESGAEWVKTTPVENPVDICGAGDSFAAGCVLALAATGDPVAAARFGNRVASVTIMKPGTGTASPEELG